MIWLASLAAFGSFIMYIVVNKNAAIYIIQFLERLIDRMEERERKKDEK